MVCTLPASSPVSGSSVTPPGTSTAGSAPDDANAIIIAGRHETKLSTTLGLIAVAASFSNMVGGFVVTDRMLHMFKAGKGKKA